MKSPQIIGFSDAEQAQYSELKVMKSAAGFYVGSSYHDPVWCMDEPGTRDTEYFQTAEQAQRRLDLITKAKNPQEYLRDHA